MANATARTETARPRHEGDFFPSEREIARRLNQTPAEWAAKAKILEGDGLPPVDPLMGGRYWPAVRRYFDCRHGVTSIGPLHHADGEENLDAL
ncbi:hypothetical protein AA309_12070 [Microvirga vignae]|uniref:Uncharacterized protein n=1 Tax=Microvirga vignae TaxID=1225564 RepID=A0A0H1RCD4_9HYPH|nr:hypothetical protein AA309_12070 [Microvirga vignae]